MRNVKICSVFLEETCLNVLVNRFGVDNRFTETSKINFVFFNTFQFSWLLTFRKVREFYQIVTSY